MLFHVEDELEPKPDSPGDRDVRAEPVRQAAALASSREWKTLIAANATIDNTT